MLRLVFADLRDHAAVWIGAFCVAMGCGFIGGFVANLQQTATFYSGDTSKLLDAGVISLVLFSSLAAVVVLFGAASLTVSVQQRSYALWQLANVKPKSIGRIVLLQLVVVALMGAVMGTLLSALTFAVLFPVVYQTYDPQALIVPRLGMARMPVVWLVVGALFVIGGLRGARTASCTAPLLVLREPQAHVMKITVKRIALFVILAFLTLSSAMNLQSQGMGDGREIPLFLTLIVALVIPLAPLVFGGLMHAWTSSIPQTCGNAWYIARHSARYGLSLSTAVETPVMVCFAVVGGVFTMTEIMTSYVQQQGITGMSTTLDFTSSVLMLGGVVLLCAIGAAVSVIMSSGSRSRDIALFLAAGALPKTLVAAAVFEAVIHTLNATLIGLLDVVVFNLILAQAFHLPLFESLSFGQAFIVTVFGFVLVLGATLVPTLRALRRETASGTSLQQ